MTKKHLAARAVLWSACFVAAAAAAMFVGFEAGAGARGMPLSGQQAFRPYGYFSLVGRPPKGFENFDTIQYWRRADEQSGPDISDRTSGLNVTGGVVYRYATISITRQKFVFTTKRVRGISYAFSGRFLTTDFVDAEMNLEKPVLTGTLTKYRDGKRTAEASVRLTYFAGT